MLRIASPAQARVAVRLDRAVHNPESSHDRLSDTHSLGRSGLRVSKPGLGSSFKAPTASYLEAFERGVNYFYWGSI